LDKLFVNFHGTSQNDFGGGAAAIGVVLTDREGNVLEEISEAIGRATGIVAEYKALMVAARAALAHNPREAIFFTESQKVANQINGLYRIRQPHLEKLNEEALALLSQFPAWKVRFVERSANWRAHKLAQQALLNRNFNRERRLVDLILERVEKLDEEGKRRVLEYVNRLLEEL